MRGVHHSLVNGGLKYIGFIGLKFIDWLVVRPSLPTDAIQPSPCLQLPPLNLGNNDNSIWEIPFLPTPPLSSVSEASTLSSGPLPHHDNSQHSGVQLGHQRPPVLDFSNVLVPSSLLRALATRVNVLVWKPKKQPRIIEKATMEGLVLHLLKSAGESSALACSIVALILIEKCTDQCDTFFIAHPAFIAPLHVLGMFIRQFDEAMMCPDEACRNIAAG